MSIEAIRCPGCHNLVNVAELEKHYATSHHDGIVPGATTIITENRHEEIPAWARKMFANTPHPKADKSHLFDSPLWGPLLRRFFPHIIFGAFIIGAILGIYLW